MTDGKRVVRLDDLTPAERRLVLALIAADRAAKERDENLRIASKTANMAALDAVSIDTARATGAR